MDGTLHETRHRCRLARRNRSKKKALVSRMTIIAPPDDIPISLFL